MRKIGRIVVTLAGVGTLIGFMYRGPIKDLADSFIRNVDFFYNINADTVKNGKVSTGSGSLAESIVQDAEIKVDEDGNFDLESAAKIIYNKVEDELPFVEKVSNWLEENIGVSLIPEQADEE